MIDLIVVECVPAVVAKAVTESVSIPVIGIGAGPYTSGQVLVYHDLLGILNHPHHQRHAPSFCKRYATLGHNIHDALVEFKNEISRQEFPTVEEYSPYKMSLDETNSFLAMLSADAEERKFTAEKAAKRLKEGDEYEVTKLY